MVIRIQTSIIANLICFLFVIPICNSLPDRQALNMERQQKSAEILKHMNLTADPCEDFYEFTCGNYQYRGEEYEEIATLPIHSMQTAMDAKWMESLSMNVTYDDKAADKIVKTFYKSCLQAPNLLGLYPYKLKRLTGEFNKMPLLEGDDWNEPCFDWLETLMKIIEKYNIPIIFLLEKAISPEGEEIILFGKPKFWLGEKWFGTKKFISQYHERYTKPIAEDLSKFLNVNVNLARQTAREIFEFEVALANYMESNEEPITYGRHYAIEILQMYSAGWDTKKLFSTILKSYDRNDLVISDDKYLRNLMNVLKRTSKRTVANYMHFIYLRHFMYGQNETPNIMAANCLKLTKKYFPENLDNLAYRKYLIESMHEGVHLLWQELKNTLRDAIEFQQIKWITEEDHQSVTEKLNQMQLKIQSYQYKDFAQEVEDLQLKEHDYIHNINGILSLRSKQLKKNIRENLNEKISTSYSYQDNTVEISVAYMQPLIYWSTSYPYAINFATMGSTIAHKMLQGLVANLNASMDFNSNTEFHELLICFAAQYTLREWTTIYDIIADNGAVQFSYQAYSKWCDKAPETTLQMELMPSVNFTNQQLFFIAYAQSSCSTQHRDKLTLIGALSNSEKFSEQFKCPKASNENPVMKCELFSEYVSSMENSVE